jgi:hypothetical protein
MIIKPLLYILYCWLLLTACTQHASQTIILPNASLYYTEHAKCRMDCRHITEYEIREVLQRGIVNGLKSNPDDQPCPTYAIEARTDEGQRLRIVFAKCTGEVKVITCIDLDHDFECDCY